MEDRLKNQISILYTQYKDDEFILNKLENYINELPNFLIVQKKNELNRKERKERLINSQDKFIQYFLTNNLYFFSPASEIFFYYDKINYTTVKEDTIIHKILQQLNFESNLLDWKYKTKISTIKAIKDNSIINSIPETTTIQKVLKIFNSYFNSIDESKHFLTIIGDLIFKKHSNIYIISINFKQILRLLEFSISTLITQCIITNHFKFKYHDQNYSDCRILTIKNICVNNINFTELNQNMLNIIIVSCYYSNRFKNADQFILEKCKNTNFSKKIFYLKDNTQKEIVNNFIEKKIILNNNSYISSKKIIYLWKLYIDEIGLPNILFNTTLKSYLRESLTYNEDNDQFINCTGIDMPLVQTFISFWEKNIVEDNDEIYIEIEEIIHFLKKENNNILIDNELIKSLINHFFNEISIENNFLYGITFKNFNKKKIIDSYLEIAKINIDIINYKSFVNFCNQYNYIVIGKQYFDEYLNSINY